MNQLSFDVIRIDGGTQPRASLNEEYIDELVQALGDGTILPPIIVFYDGSVYWLADGFHRYHATKRLYQKFIQADIRQGTRRDAVLFSVGANAQHGLRRTNADKRRAVETLLNDPEWAGWSNREIARRCAVDEITVRRMRPDLSATMSQIDTPRFVERNGTVYTQNTANIGHSSSSELRGFGRILTELDGPSLPPAQPFVPATPQPYIPSWNRVETPYIAPVQGEQPVYTPPALHAPVVTQVKPEEEEEGVFEPEEDLREIKRQQVREHLAELREKGVDLPIGKYSCLVVDPPWPMQKIERDIRPNQVEFEYPTMSEDELRAFPLLDFAADNCHLYLWTTQKYLPMALRLAEHWGFKYQCLMTWVKNVGFTPFSWMYSTEHVLFCTRGSLPLLALGKRLDFSARVREHSRKPDEFYDLVRECSPGPRLDVFSREKRDGFEQYGNEVEKYVS